MTVIASCGHAITGDWFHDDRSSVVVAAHDRRGDRVLSYEVRCPDCRERLVLDGRLLTSPAAEHAWLQDGRGPAPSRQEDDHGPDEDGSPRAPADERHPDGT